MNNYLETNSLIQKDMTDEDAHKVILDTHKGIRGLSLVNLFDLNHLENDTMTPMEALKKTLQDYLKIVDPAGYATVYNQSPNPVTITPEKAHMDAFLSGDGTAGHSKGNWEVRNCAETPTIVADGKAGIASMIAGNTPNGFLLALAQSAPHDCGDPECPGVINKRKLELYDKFQTVINEFAKAGLLT